MGIQLESVLHEGAIWRAGNRGTILVVEDPFVQQYLRAVLARNGYCAHACDARSAVQRIEAALDPVSLIITNSPAAFRAFAERVPLLYIAGAPDPALVSDFLCCRLLKKPFHPDDLVAAVRALME